nr:hypothetical protein [Tanacetum cinerariifolium]
KYAHVEEHGLKVNDLEDQSHQEFNTGNDDETYVRESPNVDKSQSNPSSSPTPDREWHKQRLLTNDHLNHGSHKWLKLLALNLRSMNSWLLPSTSLHS